jgi:hypothetical protein
LIIRQHCSRARLAPAANPRHGNAGHDPEKACPGRDPGWVPVSRLREALARLAIWLGASAGEGRSEKIMLQE